MKKKVHFKTCFGKNEKNLQFVIKLYYQFSLLNKFLKKIWPFLIWPGNPALKGRRSTIKCLEKN